MTNTSSERGASSDPGKKSYGKGGTNSGPGGVSKADLSGQVSGAIREGAREMKEQALNVAESAKELVSQAGGKLLSSVEDQKTAGADFASGMAGAIRRAASEFDKSDMPQAAQYIRLAADQIDTVSDAFRRRDLQQLVADVQGFARRQPTAFLGAAVLAGFGVVRFLKTSTVGAIPGNTQGTSTHVSAGSRSMSGNQPAQYGPARSQT
jgi:hypothetical protein